MATRKEDIDLPICIQGFSIGDEFLMETHTNLYMVLEKEHQAS